MRKVVVALLLVCVLVPVLMAADSGNNDGSLKLETDRLENAQSGTTVKDDIYTNYGLKLFDAASEAQAQSNAASGLEARQNLQRQLFAGQGAGANGVGFDMSSLFASSYQGKTAPATEAAEGNSSMALYAVIAVVVVGLVAIIIRFAIKDGGKL